MSSSSFSAPHLPAPPQTEGQIDLRAYWRVIVRRRWLIAFIFLLSIGVASAWALRLPRLYTATTTLVIDTAAPKALGAGTVQDVADNGQPAFWLGKEYYETQYNIMRSR